MRVKTPAISLIMLALLNTGCSNPTSDTEDTRKVKSDKEMAIEKVCSKVTSTQVVDIYGAREAISELVQIDSNYMPLLEEMARFVSVMRERTTYPKQYPDMQLLKSFCSSLKS